MSASGWVAVDLDGTLAQYGGWKPLISNNQARKQGLIGPPVPAMLAKVKQLLAAKVEVRIFTARVCDGDPETVRQIQDWCEEHVGQRLKVTNVKDFAMVCIYDDRAIAVERNTGRVLGGEEP